MMDTLPVSKLMSESVFEGFLNMVRPVRTMVLQYINENSTHYYVNQEGRPRSEDYRSEPTLIGCQFKQNYNLF